jgi:hypothetical protein
MKRAMLDAAQIREDLRDLVNASLEMLAKERFELPGFSTMVRAARKIRSEVNRAYYQKILDALSEEERARLDQLLEASFETMTTAWRAVNGNPFRNHDNSTSSAYDWPDDRTFKPSARR